MIHMREKPNRTMPHTICNTPLIRASNIPTVKYTTHRKKAHGTATRARNTVLIILIGFITVVVFESNADLRVE